jgi:oxygen-independent coproporphyrinogen-3 oxidase
LIYVNAARHRAAQLANMTITSSLFDPSALARSVPRYTSYPTAPHFSGEVGPETYARWLEELPGQAALSLYMHIPYCDDLCWFCACRTQGTKRYEPIARYLDCLEAEIALVAGHLGGAHPVTQVHWGGGSPTILRPEDILRLRATVLRYFPRAKDGEFAVEIDPRDMNPARLDALAEAGLTRASIGVQDFDERVQKAIGRRQGYEMTRDVIAGLRGHGISGVNVDILYGLPRQTRESLSRTIELVIGLRPDRIALFGYAHVPWMAKRQKMIDEAQLPGPDARRRQSMLAANMLTQAGYQAIGIDHFSLPGDSLARARDDGALRRNFQGYTVDPADALIGLGASAIGCLPQGYVQNDPVTATYQLRVEAGAKPTRRGHALTLDDQVRRDAIEQILCQFGLDIDALTARYGDFARPVQLQAAGVMEAAPDGVLTPWRGGFRIDPDWRHYSRLIAAEFDTYLPAQPARHSLAL